MSQNETSPTETSPDVRALWAERQGRPEYIGYNSRGAEVRIGKGDAEGVFSPGELLKIALAACTALSTDHVLRSRLGEDYPAAVGVSSTGVPDENRYGSLDVELVLDLAELDEGQRAKLAERIDRTSSRQCTVGRTIKAGATYEVTVTDEPLRAER
ncbi:OsmC family protein [Georgenia sp. MJ170]|uniref:OsmC family protein n=1 Tax=Georgenia sunbinii TaxID=3117728 RepID=UPI002F25F18D